MLNEEQILTRANELYAEAKLARRGVSYSDDVIKSDQVKCLLRALVEALNAKVQH